VQFETVPSAALGEYRLVARGVAKVGGAKSSYELISRGFTVTKSTAVVGRARMTMDGRFALEARFPPNPTVHAADIDDVVLNYRVRDLNSDPRVGALARGAMGSSVQGALINPDSSMSAVTLTWSDAEAAWVSAPLAAGTYRFDVAAGGVVDAQGNENGAAVSVSP
jgi:hypothetical protein